MDKDKAIRSAKLTAAGILDKARARTAVTRAGGQIAPSKYLPNVPRQVHADGGPAMFQGIHPDLQGEGGAPLDLYHGTGQDKEFEAFDNAKLGARDAGFYGRGHYLTPVKGNAEGYADPDEMGKGTVIGPLHAALKNPYVWDVSNDMKAHSTLRDLQSMGIMREKDELNPWDNLQQHHIKPFMAEMQKRGHDGVMVKTGNEDMPNGISEVVAFNPNTIKHKDAEVFDPNDPRIRREDGGSVTDTDEFRNWFGNSVTHTDGDPHVFYTGTSKDKDFTSFNVGRHGAWFTRDPALASQYAEQNDSQGYKQDGWKLTPINTASRVIPAYVKAENPYTGDLPDEVLRSNYKAAQSDWFDTLRRKGHDAWIPARHNGDLVVALKEPQQIKSIFNNGKFDPNQKHMNKAGGGEVEEDGITAYHGSPHSFDSFDISKLGTGEGAQAYGHGLYFAGNEKIAKHYRDMLAPRVSGNSALHTHNGDIDAAIAEANQRISNYEAMEPSRTRDGLLQINKQKLLDLTSRKAGNGPLAGHMYKVKLNVKPHELLDWDKPLSEQHPNVQAAIKATGVDTGARKWENGADMGNGSRLVVTPHPDLPDEEEFTKYEMQLPSGSRVRLNRNDVARVLGDENLQPNGLTGAQIHQRLVDMGNRHGAIGEHLRAGNPMKRGDKWASEALMEQGLKGIKYRDAGSRDMSDGDPTHNYVMFHHDPVQVVDKYEYGGAIPKARDVSAALALTRRFTKDGTGATMALKPKGK